MKRQFIANLILVIALNILIKPIYIFGIDRTVQNLVGPASYGLFFALFNFTYLFQMLNDFGIQNFNHAVFSKHPRLIPKYLPKIVSTKLSLGLLYLIMVICLAYAIGYKSVIFPMMLTIIFNQILTSFLLFFRTSLSASGFYETDSWLSVSDKLVMIFLVGYVIWFSGLDHFRIEWFVFAQSISLLIALSIARLSVRSRLKIKRISIGWDFRFMLWLLKRTSPYALVLLLMTLYTRMDAVMIERMLPDGKIEAGIYAAAFRILDAVNMVGILFAGLLLPMFAKMIRKGQPLEGLVQTGFSLIWTIAVMVVVISWFFGKEIMVTLYSEANAYWGEVFTLLMISYLAFSTSYIFGTLLTANESISKMNQIFLGGVVTNLVLNIVFILQWKAWGAALATVITQSLVVILLILIVKKSIKISLSFKIVLKALGYLVSVFFVGWIILEVQVSWISQMLMVCGLAWICSILFGQFPIRQAWKSLNR
jgi:O-antigen/teichoic acid export membrane protein